MKIAFATNNEHKLEEMRQVLGHTFDIVSLAELGCHDDIPETGDTLEENALMKARYIYERYGVSVFADDTGLEVEALGGAPGVRSARYAGGAGHDSEANMAKLLGELGQNNNRHARFRTVIALFEKTDDAEKPLVTTFEGIVEGEIAHSRHGAAGFGYDPIFRPEGSEETFAEMGAEAKNAISHRARAAQKLADHLLRRH